MQGSKSVEKGHPGHDIGCRPCTVCSPVITNHFNVGNQTELFRNFPIDAGKEKVELGSGVTREVRNIRPLGIVIKHPVVAPDESHLWRDVDKPKKG